MKVRILPYKAGSKSARALVNALSPIAIMKKQTTRMKGRSKVLINWGHSNPKFDTTGCTILNQPEAVALSSNKLTALLELQGNGISVPDFTTDIETAKGWIEDERIVLCRTLLRANSGRGIVIAKTAAELVHAPLYVKYIRKEKEFRVHVFNGKVIDFVEKKRRVGFSTNCVYNKFIRSYERGWIMARDNVSITDETKRQALQAVEVLGLDFGAVDIVMNRDNLPVVLEVNTAAGIQGTTLANYKKAVTEWLNQL